MRRWFLIGLTLLVLAAAGMAYFAIEGYRAWLNTARSPKESESVLVEVAGGTGVRGVLQLLIDKGLVKKTPYLRLVGRLGGLPSSVQAGEYELHAGLTPLQMLEIMARGKVKEYPFTIREGLRLTEVGDELQRLGIAKKKDLLALAEDRAFLGSLGLPGLEGYLFPDTYFVPRGVSIEAVVRKMVDTFNRHFEESLKKRAQSLGLSPHDALVIASIIEKEAGNSGEYPLISSVIQNRLKRGMPLQMDPTVVYGLKRFDGNITRRDLNTDHPWNTYTRHGLPPTPICNPGLGSLQAAVNPASTNYLYFVSMNNGTHFFSSNLRQHNEAVQRFQVQGEVEP